MASMDDIIALLSSANYLQLIFEFGAVVIGVYLAFWLDRRHDRAVEREETIEFLELIRDELSENTNTLENVFDDFERKQPFQLPYFRLRVFALTALSNRIVLVDKKRLRTDIIRAYYKFDMYERKTIRPDRKQV